MNHVSNDFASLSPNSDNLKISYRRAAGVLNSTCTSRRLSSGLRLQEGHRESMSIRPGASQAAGYLQDSYGTGRF